MWLLTMFTYGLVTIPMTVASSHLEQSILDSDFQISGNATYSCRDAGGKCNAIVNTLGEGHGVFHQTLSASLLQYHSDRQNEVRPLCLATPRSVEDVSAIMKVIAEYNCPFAAKSGGHAMFAGASSARDGVTIDLRYLRQLELIDGGDTVLVGSGNDWGRVYTYLDGYNLTAIGGRVGDVGVGGFLLGGGISFSSRRWGLGADNVRNFEVVLGDGTIVNANHETHPDLYWALRGGGAGFGIVTRFDLETHPIGLVWGSFNVQIASDAGEWAARHGHNVSGTTMIDKVINTILPYIKPLACSLGFCSSIDTLLQHTWDMLDGTKDDLDSQSYGIITLMNTMEVTGFHMVNTKGVSDVPAYRAARKGRKVINSARVAHGLAPFADEMSIVTRRYVDRVSYATLTFKSPDLELMKRLTDIWIREMFPMKKMKDGYLSLAIMFLTSDEIVHMSRNGGNPLGLKPEDGNLMVICPAFGWPNKEDDTKVMGMVKRFIDATTAMAKEHDQHHPFLYQNYAAEFQDVFAGYGEGNRKQLRSIQQKYDKDDVFQRLQAGYFKV